MTKLPTTQSSHRSLFSIRGTPSGFARSEKPFQIIINEPAGGFIQFFALDGQRRLGVTAGHPVNPADEQFVVLALVFFEVYKRALGDV